ncbi:DUF58 domain-containing protein [Clostridium sp. MSJ-4]|uniref:DUF58 domain-containing protein n=1 Tax=Clostridium simiarum TaxID=2841506 RepID=A0ABS6EYS8_9CLOT|nr:DUF58 domain-containing protein [Clostridium simiarum]MBU5591361.1 DUF58 domain-containing protein [Clostridium simiarum]
MLDSRYEGEAMSLRFFQNLNYEYHITFRKRGIYNINDFKVNTSDLFNFINIEKKIKNRNSIKVYPRIYDLDESISSSNEFSENPFLNKGFLEDIYSVKEMREYRDGDSLKRINWKVSAKLNKLFVKSYEVLSYQEVIILLDMNKDVYEIDKDGLYEESLIDMCVSIVNYISNKGFRVKLHINSKMEKFIEVNNKDDFNKVMEFFVENKSDGVKSYDTFIKTKARESRGNTMILITSNITESLLKSIEGLKGDGQNIALFYLGKVERKDRIEYLSKLGVILFDICSLAKWD